MKYAVKLLCVVGLFFTCSYIIFAQPAYYCDYVSPFTDCHWEYPIYKANINDAIASNEVWDLIYQVRKCTISNSIQFKINAFRSCTPKEGKVNEDMLKVLLKKALCYLLGKDNITAQLAPHSITLGTNGQIMAYCFMSSCWKLPEYQNSSCYSDVDPCSNPDDPSELLLPCGKPVCCIYSGLVTQHGDCLTVMNRGLAFSGLCGGYENSGYSDIFYGELCDDHTGDTGVPELHPCKLGLCLDYFKDPCP